MCSRVSKVKSINLIDNFDQQIDHLFGNLFAFNSHKVGFEKQCTVVNMYTLQIYVVCNVISNSNSNIGQLLKTQASKIHPATSTSFGQCNVKLRVCFKRRVFHTGSGRWQEDSAFHSCNSSLHGRRDAGGNAGRSAKSRRPVPVARRELLPRGHNSRRRTYLHPLSPFTPPPFTLYRGFYAVGSEFRVFTGFVDQRRRRRRLISVRRIQKPLFRELSSSSSSSNSSSSSHHCSTTFNLKSLFRLRDSYLYA